MKVRKGKLLSSINSLYPVFAADFYIAIPCASKIVCLRQILPMWDLATTNTDCKVRVLNSMAVAILSSKAGMAWGR